MSNLIKDRLAMVLELMKLQNQLPLAKCTVKFHSSILLTAIHHTTIKFLDVSIITHARQN